MTLNNSKPNNRINSHDFDFEGRNLAYEGSPAVLDNPNLDNMFVYPYRFNTSSSLYELSVQFQNLNATPKGIIEACAIDIQQNKVCHQMGYFSYNILVQKENS